MFLREIELVRGIKSFLTCLFENVQAGADTGTYDKMSFAIRHFELAKPRSLAFNGSFSALCLSADWDRSHSYRCHEFVHPDGG
jgi:hypothetical protein